MTPEADVIVTVDYEERFHGLISIDEANFPEYDPRLPEVTPELLSVLSKHDTSATFFALGQLTETQPDLIRQIADQDHEIASHGWSHTHLSELSRGEFQREVSESRRQLASVSGQEVAGFRAPFFSLPYEQRSEYFQILRKEGYRYDASLNRFSNPLSGHPDAPNRPETYGKLQEIPLSTTRILGIDWPVTGGFYFRLLPYVVTRSLIRRVLEQQGPPVIFYFHPWSLEDVDWSLWMGCNLREKVTHFWGRSRFVKKLNRLLSDFRTTSIRNYLKGRE